MPDFLQPMRRGTPEEVIAEIQLVLAGRRQSVTHVVLASLVADWLHSYPPEHRADVRREFSRNVTSFLKKPG